MKKLQYGRSMIEMLGVLAIIGVLSVGAIAGYQKAMFKYKLNKQAYQINTIMTAIERHYKSFYEKLDSTVESTSYFIKMGLIPKEMIKQNNYNRIYDVFNTEIKILRVPDKLSGETSMNLVFYLNLGQRNRQNEDICINIFETIKQNRSLLDYVVVAGTQDGTYGSMGYYGDKVCNASSKCIKDMSINDMHDVCISQILKEDTYIKITWY